MVEGKLNDWFDVKRRFFRTQYRLVLNTLA